MRIKNQLKWAMGGVLGVLFFSLALAQEDIAKGRTANQQVDSDSCAL